MVERFNIEITVRSALWEKIGRCSFVFAIIKRDGDSDLAEESIEPITDNTFFRLEKISLCLFFSGIFAQKIPARGRKTEYFITMALVAYTISFFSRSYN